ncbi:MAG: zinc ribbon domain-containing protein [Clostridia bacterium]|nr:zinc ribbon domain-containing protein [Clostridia bacterium]
MDFFNKLTKKASQTYKEASKKTGDIAKEAKLRMKMNDAKSKINNAYEEIGKKVYEKHTTNGEISIEKDLEEELTQIDVLSAEVEACLKEIMKLKNKKQCTNCFAELPLDAKFCGNCGATQETEIEVKVEQETEQEEEIQEQETDQKSESTETTDESI